jgi:RecB family exonuclease
VISPRRTRLVRVPDLTLFRRAIFRLLPTSHAASVDTAIVVPTRGAARQFEAYIDAQGSGDRGRPAIVTRDHLYDELHGRFSTPVRRLTAVERDGMAQASAMVAVQTVPSLTFKVRPGLVVEILRFYDQLRRQAQGVQRFEELLEEALAPGVAADDRGAVRMRDQTRFLARTFREYEARVESSGGDDEHRLRDRVVRGPLDRPLRQVIVTVADWIADPDGLFNADFDLLARMPGTEALDIVVTAGVLESGFHERIHQYWPGLEEVDGSSALGLDPAVPRPTLCVPQSGEPPPSWFTCRDREEELVRVARQMKGRRIDGPALGRHAVVFRRPLPYLYLAADTFDGAGLAFRSTDELPLAAEPVAAAVDVVLECVENEFARAPLVALLGSPHFAFIGDGARPTRESLAALNRLLSDARFLGTAAGFAQLAHAGVADPEWEAAGLSLRAALSVVRRLAPLAEPQRASLAVDQLAAFLRGALRPLAAADPFLAREERARDAIFDVLERLARSLAEHHDPVWTSQDLGTGVRRWIELRTFAPSPSAVGIHLLDDQAARYGEFDEMTLVGLVEHEWPDKPRRNIFYPPNLLKALGWPTERDRRSAATARFLDVVASPTARITISTFLLEDEAMTGRSILLDEIPTARLSTVPETLPETGAVLFDDLLAAGAPGLDAVPEAEREWAAERAGRSGPNETRFHGGAGALPQRPWSVSALETYLTCPFKFFARYVLELEEDPDDDEALDPRRQGMILHDAFETFYDAWQKAGHGAVTAENLDAARALWVELVERALEGLSDTDASLERTRLLGSSAATGLGEAALRMEAERSVPVIQRLLEVELNGPLTLTVGGAHRVVEIRGKADRIDILADGTFRLIDYKLGTAPKTKDALQLPIYALRAEQRFRAEGRPLTVSEAAYLAFRGPKRVNPLFEKPEDREAKLNEAQGRLIEVLDGIERGEFPPRPQDVFWCERCAFGSVCRRDYVGDV